MKMVRMMVRTVRMMVRYNEGKLDGEDDDDVELERWCHNQCNA